jgi:hypothetical protein
MRWCLGTSFPPARSKKLAWRKNEVNSLCDASRVMILGDSLMILLQSKAAVPAARRNLAATLGKRSIYFSSKLTANWSRPTVSAAFACRQGDLRLPSIDNVKFQTCGSHVHHPRMLICMFYTRQRKSVTVIRGRATGRHTNTFALSNVKHII